ncbi:flagellar hook-associated protein FlgK [Roseisalinus antarcticus]|uniref:Flagellar hook-associated protein 1 n=1 Tax=Roseisalinus antarcticus TaxID=254357 RepID=A0A1Y5TNH0_9RHOB|nr:flagellar hook-associated protein FlgK [Roseisalinus antarcticus]SLN66001.1 Flagellar hook-associated protein 1 [Roseisalinus antarcticus]
MSISQSINSAISGLNVASRKAEVVSSNIANALTEGYGRRTVSISGGEFGGVQMDGIVRHMDRGIVSDRRLAEAGIGAYRQTADFLERMERLVGQVGETGAITTRMSELEKALVSATADPGSDVRLNLVVDRLNGLARAVNATSDGLQAMRMEAENAIVQQVATLNDSLARVEELNADILAFEGRGIDPSSLLDARQLAVDEIARIVPVREIDRGRGQIALMTPSGQSLIDGKAVAVGFDKATYISPDMTLASGGLNGITINGSAIRGTGGAGRLDGGTLGSYFELRDEFLVDAHDKIDAIARDMIERFQDDTTDPTLGLGDAGLLTDAGAAFDPADTAGLAARISVNAAVDPDEGGALYRVRDGVMATTPGPAGSSAQLNRWLDAVHENRPTHLSGEASSVAGHMASFLSDLGGQRLSVEKDLTFQTARWETLKDAELATGVDTDIELQNLLQIEQAYAANAKVLQTVDLMIQRLLEI